MNATYRKGLLISRIFILLMMVACTHTAYCQMPLKWTKTYNNATGIYPFDFPVNAVTDNAGNAYTIIKSFNSLSNTCGNGPYKINSVTLMKYDASGSQVFSRSLEYYAFREPKDLKIDGSGHLYALFLCRDSAMSVFFLTVKYDLQGNELWKRKFVENTYWNNPKKLLLDHSGNILALGDYQAVKYSSSGSQMWSVNLGTLNAYPRDLATDSLNNIVIVGRKYPDLFVAKYDSNGVYQWQKTLTGSTPGSAMAVKTDSRGNIYAAGYLDKGGSLAEEFALIKFRQNGDTVWKRTFNAGGTQSDTLKCIAIDPNDNVYVSGYNLGMASVHKFDSLGVLKWTWAQTYAIAGPYSISSADMVWDNGTLLVCGTTISSGGPASAGGNMMLIKLNALNGSLLWSKKNFGNATTSCKYGGGLSVVKDVNGNYITCGYTQDNFTYSNVRLYKYDVNGNQIYSTFYNGGRVSHDSPDKSILNSNHELIVAGGTQDSLVATDNGGDQRYNSLVYLKYDSLGNKIWEKILHYPGTSDYRIQALILDAGNHIISVASEKYSSDVRIIKLDNNGNLLWDKSYPLYGFEFLNLWETATGFTLVSKTGILKCNSSGDSLQTIFNPGNYSLGAIIDADRDASGNIYCAHHQYTFLTSPSYLSRVSPSGALTWQVQTPVADQKTALKINAQNELILCTYYSLPGPTDFYIITSKINTANGATLAADTFAIQQPDLGAFQPPQLLTDNSSNIYYAVPYVVDVNSNADYRAIVTKLSANGSLAWRKTVYTSVGGYMTIDDAAVDGSGSLYITGSYLKGNIYPYSAGMLYRFDNSGSRKDSMMLYDYSGKVRMNNLVLEDGLVYQAGKDNDNMIINCVRGPVDLVWPGDANSDGIADNLDVLELGLHYTQSGIPRSILSNSWQGFSALLWPNTITSGKNLKHSDCNGDGTVNSNDTLAIFNNYGLTHAFKQADQTVTNAQLRIVPDQAAVAKGNWGTASVFLGEASAPITGINGLAFTVTFDQNLIDANSFYIEYPASFLNTGNQNLKFSKPDVANGKLYTATTHTNNTNVSGHGKIAVLHYKIKSNLATDEVLNIGIIQTKQSNAAGTLMPLTAGTATIAAVGASVGIDELSNTNSIGLYPNPANSTVNIQSSATLEKIELLSLTGQLILTEKTSGSQHQLNLTEVANGVYFVIISDATQKVTRKKLVVQH